MANETQPGPSPDIVRLRLLGKGNGAASGQQAVEALLCGRGRQSLMVSLSSPFIDGHHIMMSMPDGSSCQLEVSYPEDSQPVRRVEVLRFNKEKNEETGKFCFVVELGYVADAQDSMRHKIWAPFMRKAGQLIRTGEDF